MVHFRIWPTAAAGAAVLATTAIALAGVAPADTGSVRANPPVTRPVTLVRHPVATTVTNRSTAVVRRPVTALPVTRTVVPRANQDADDNRLLGRIDQINRENCALATRERPTFDTSILAGIIEQRRDACMRQRFGARPFSRSFRDADDHRFSNGRPFDADDHRFSDGRPFVADDRRMNAARFDDRRDDRQFSRARFDRDDRRANPERFATAARFRTDHHVAANRSFAANRRFAASHANRPMGRPRP